jgi:hypothetical protein
MNRSERLHEGIARIRPDSHTVITRFLEHYWTADVEHRIDAPKWSVEKVIVEGQVLHYDGPQQQLLPLYSLNKGDNVLLLNFNEPEIAHPEFLRSPCSVHEPMKQVLEKIALDTADTNTHFIVAASWERLMDALVKLAPRFSVVGLVNDGWAKQSLLKDAAKLDPRIWEKALILGHFPVVAITPIDLYESVTGREFP